MRESTWAEEKARETQQRRNTKRLADQKFVAEENLKRVETPNHWGEVRSIMASRVRAFGKALGEEDVLFCNIERPDVIEIRIKNNPAKVLVTFDFEAFRIVYHGVNTLIEYRPQVQNGEVVFVDQDKRSATSEGIAEVLLEDIIKLV
jgi:hypothetical protein